MKSSRKIAISACLVAVILFGFVFYKLSTVTGYIISGDQGKCFTNDDLLREMDATGKNYFSIDFEKVETKIKQNFLCIHDIGFSFSPQKLKIEITQRIPLARLVTSESAKVLSLSISEASPSTTSALLDWNFKDATSGAEYLIIDREGFIFDQKVDNSLPAIYIEESNLSKASSLDRGIYSSIHQIFDKLSDLMINADDYKVVSKYFLVNSYPRLVFHLGRDITAQLASLQLIVNKARIDNSEIESIDLRFNNPVVIYSDKKTTSSKREDN